jgi:hypothetical protein
MGEIHWVDHFKEELEGKTIEKLHCYGWYKNSNISKEVSYRELEDYIREEDWRIDNIEPIREKKVIVKDGFLVGGRRTIYHY